MTVATSASDGGSSEGDETFLLKAAASGNETTAVGTIYDLPTSAPRLDVTAPATIAENAGTAAIVASIASPLSNDISIPVSAAGVVVNGVAAAVSTGGITRDFTALATDAAITIPAGATTGSLQLTINDDNVDEPDNQTIRVTIGSTLPANVTTDGTMTADVAIVDNDAAPTVSIGNAPAVTEGSLASFPVKLSGLSEKTLTVNLSTQNGSDTATARGALGGDGTTNDFTTETNTPVTFLPLTQTVFETVTTRNDTNLEGTEVFSAALSVSSTNTVALGTPTTASATINDNEAVPGAVFKDMDAAGGTQVTYAEGATGTVAAEIQVEVNLTSFQTRETPLKLDYKFEDGTATNGVDYKGTAGTITIPTTETGTLAGGVYTYTAKIPVSIIGDTIEEGTEAFNVVLSSSNSTFDTSSAGLAAPQSVTLTESTDDVTPTWTMSDVSVVEGNEGQTMARVPIAMSAAAGSDVTFTADFSSPGSATETGVNSGTTVGDNDYDIPASRSVTIKAGEKAGYIDVPVNGDAVYERDEALIVALSTGSSAVDSDPSADVSHSARVTITNDDAKPTVKLNEIGGAEGTTVRVMGTLVGVSQYNYTLGITTAGTGDNKAGAGSDYEVPTGLATKAISVKRGDTALSEADSKLAEFYLLPDDIDEPTETFGVTVAESTASPQGFASVTGTYRITDDPADVPPAAKIRDESIGEWEGSVDVHVDMEFDENTKSTTQTVKIPYWTEDGNATAGEDYKSARGELAVAPGTTTAKINVEILNDKIKESPETFKVVLGDPTSPSGATVKKSTGTVTIKSEDTSSPVTPTINVTGPAKGAGNAVISGDVEANAAVELWGAPIAGNGELKYLAGGKADGNGNYSFTRAISTGYRFAVQSQEINSPERAVKITQNPVFAVSSTKGKLAVSVTGNPKGSGQAVVIQKMSGGKWVTAYKGTTTATGFQKTYTVKSKTKLTLRAFIAGNTSAGVNGGYSASKSITIK